MVEAYGYFSYAFTIVLYLMNFVDLGLSTYGIREIAKNKNRTFKYVSDIVSFRFLVALFLFFLFALIIFLKKSPLNVKLLNLEMGLFLFLSALATEWAFQGREKMHMVFVSYLVTSLLQLLLLFSFVKSPKDLAISPILIFIGALPITLIFLRILKFVPESKRIDFRKIKLYLSRSVIIWAISIFAQVYNGFDIVLLGLIKNVQEVGYFTVARQAIWGIVIFAVFLSNAVFPKLAVSFRKDFKAFTKARSQFLKVLVALGIFTLLPLGIFTKDILNISVGSAYFPAEAPIRILIFASIFVFLNLPFSTSLIASGFEKKVLKQAVASAILSVFLNLILIPKFGMIGTSLTYLFIEAFSFVWISIIYYSNIKRSVFK